MPYIYQVFVEYEDQTADRFWYTTQQVVSDVPLPGYQVFREADKLIAQQLAGPQYEQLRDYLAANKFDPIEQITAAYFLPP